MTHWTRLGAMVLLGTVVTATADAADYTISNDTLLYIKVYKDPDTLAAGISHDHAIKAGTVNGSIAWDAADPSTCNISLTIPVSSLSPDETWLRKAAGLEGELDDDMREDVKKNMLSTGQLNADAYPNITFQSTSCTTSSISGNLTIRGVSKAVQMATNVTADDTSFKASGSVSIKASEFGFEPYSALFGQLKNRDGMELKIKLVGSK